ncbi:MAG: ABC transporter permease [Vicinamibacterales bacterium]
MQGLWRDVRFAITSLRRSPGFTLAALVTLTAGIGAVAAVFTLVNALLLEPLPYPAASRLVSLTGELRRDSPRAYPLGYQDLLDVRSQDAIFEVVSPVSSLRPFNLGSGLEVEHVNGEMVAGTFFEVFGLAPTLGRTFTADEWPAPNATPVVVLAHDFWRRRFGGDPGVLGRQVRLNDRGYQVIGVAAPGFRGVTGAADLWLPIGLAGPIYGPHYTGMRMFRWLEGIARLKPGVSLEQARAALETWSRQAAAAYPQENRDLFVIATPFQDALVGDSRTPLLALLGAAAFVLLIGCVNVANLLLARGLSREREVAVRRALGAPAGRIVRQFVTESLVLAVPAAAGGVLLARGLTAYLSSVWAADLTSFVDVAVDVRVLAATVALSAISAMGFGIAPAISAARVGPHRTLVDGARGATAGGARRRVQSALIVGEVALALALLTGAALMTKGFSRFVGADLGFVPEGVLTISLDLTADQYKEDERFWTVARSVLDAARATPGVATAALEGPGFPTSGYYAVAFRKFGADADAPLVSVLRHHVSPDYFRTLGIRLVAGRTFEAADGAAAPRVVVVSETLAARTWPGEDPVGQRLLPPGEGAEPYTVIGVVTDVRHDGRVEATPRDPDLYIPVFQSAARSPSLLTLLARTSGRPGAVAPALEEAIRRAAPGLPPYDTRTLQDRLDEQTVRGRFAVRLMIGFAGVALALAIVGVYGVIAYAVNARTREIGIRTALGASRAGTVWLILRQGLVPVMFGIAGGLLAVAGLERFVRSLLYDVQAADPWVLGGAAAVLAVVGAAAAAVPAWRAARIPPVIAMRAE